MADYQAPLDDIRFLLKDVFKVDEFWASLPGVADVIDTDTADAILEEVGKIAATAIAPLNHSGDEQGADWNGGDVKAPAGFKEAYQTLCEGGWCGLGGSPEFGGMGMPKSLTAQVEEMIQGASLAFGLAPMLTAGACLSLLNHGSQELKEKYLPKMYSGEWSGAMDLTEPHAGTDLGIIRTKAIPSKDGTYSITGTKIFITWGDHDMADNIIHFVLAKLPDAPAGSKGISLFLVPKFHVNDDGSLGERNQFACGSIEKKMGIKGSATCVMNYDGAKGWMVGEPNKGLAAMFTMMNYERLAVGIQGLGIAEASYQSAIEYARERIQSRSAQGPQNPEKSADPIIVHADVRRMLMTMKAWTEGSRAFSTYVASWLDRAKFAESQEDKTESDGRVALLTPVAKAFMTDRALETTVIGQQVFGGHGYIAEWGQEQLVRDVRITQIYEGTNGIQAMDLMGRKVLGNRGEWLSGYIKEIQSYAESVSSNDALAGYAATLIAEANSLSEVAGQVADQTANDREAPGAAAVDFLDLVGYVSYAYMWLKIADAASQQDSDFAKAKLKTAQFFYQRLLPTTQSLRAKIAAGSDSMNLAAELF
ncbi:acyl-CoA dehydrogenase C-terminal domain-containing protein [Marinibactrum halimedae]|uniref:3-methylmercaptopropionyl-CoA dehydrogenase n=1 Tax=Marinibactrum halimedae TaxID=1444977 RepID=A0AA37WKV8_9GAMM|nr:acyl-CoA dehydrogenase C-terminal domain-containing protein [Marinibactrum halimedae]MCD9458136.1 acyl-CoA dehydrogenase C-terminal domain-containing protein [Marinibactrum halimedae]GLS25069.1 acyl-CoA dehydrogenase [Marinibactrum halimedae]